VSGFGPPGQETGQDFEERPSEGHHDGEKTEAHVVQEEAEGIWFV